jgi:hypothetical protein
MHEELHNLCSSSVRVKKSYVYDLCVSFGAYVGEEKCMLCFFEEIRRIEITRKTWYKLENNIKMKMKGLEGFELDSSG